MVTDNIKTFVIIVFLLLGVLFGVMILSLIFSTIGNATLESTTDEIVNSTLYLNDSITLSNFNGNIVTEVFNDTWLNFDGVNDVLEILINEPTVSFWYRNSTSIPWIFIVNSSGTLYVNANVETPVEYPVLQNTTGFYLGQFNNSVFFNGSMDEIRIYNRTLNAGEVLTLFNLGK